MPGGLRGGPNRRLRARMTLEAGGDVDTAIRLDIFVCVVARLTGQTIAAFEETPTLH
jgi:hypothetical protein